MAAVLIACCKAKLDHAAPAAELYQGDLFKKSLAYARCFYPRSPIFVLSALYGVVGIDDVIEPYEKTLNTMRAREVDAWARATAADLEAILGPRAHYVVLAGAKYRKVLKYLPQSSYEVPMSGMGIGQQKGWLKRKLQECL